MRAEPILASRLVGTWRLVDWTISADDGSVRRPYGEQPDGLLSYTADGHMQVNIAARDRAPVLAAASTDAERRDRAFLSYFAYGGTWTVAGADVMHRVETALVQGLVGTNQVRRADLDGTALALSADAVSATTGRTVRHVLRWRRAG